MEYKVGNVVISKAGRDKGRKMVIVGLDKQGYCLVADGKLRKIEKPKRKKLMHVKLTNAEKVTANTNKQLRAICLEPEPKEE